MIIYFTRCRWGVHLFCLPKINEPNKRAPDIAFDPKIRVGWWRGRKLATLKHSTTFFHQPTLIFGGNRRDNEGLFLSPFVLTRSDIYSGQREASVWFVASMPLPLRAPPASKFVPDKFVSGASFSRPPESMLWRVTPQASTVGCPRVVREMGKHFPDSLLRRN